MTGGTPISGNPNIELVPKGLEIPSVTGPSTQEHLRVDYRILEDQQKPVGNKSPKFVDSSIFWLVVGPPLWKIWKSVGMIIPNIWDNKKCSKPPTSFFFRGSNR